jgi:hypothetical protein
MKKVSQFILLALLLYKVDSYGQTEKLKTVFIYNFSKYIQWPSESSSGNFEIGIVGETPLFKELQKMAQTRKVGSQPIEIKQYASIQDVENDHIVFVSIGSSPQLGQIVQKANSFPTLLITEKEGLVNQGSCINFLFDSGKLTFEISKSNIEYHALKVSSQLLNLGKQVQ